MNKKTIVGLVLAALIAVGSFLTGGNLETAIKIAFDKDAAVVACSTLLKDADAAAMAVGPSAPVVTP